MSTDGRQVIQEVSLTRPVEEGENSAVTVDLVWHAFDGNKPVTWDNGEKSVEGMFYYAPQTLNESEDFVLAMSFVTQGQSMGMVPAKCYFDKRCELGVGLVDLKRFIYSIKLNIFTYFLIDKRVYQAGTL